MAIKIPYKQMFSWKAGNLGLSLVGVWYILLAFLQPKAYGTPSIGYSPNIGLLMIGLMFFSISLINSVGSPSLIGALCAMLIGLAYFIGWLVIPSMAGILWIFSIIAFLGVCVTEFGIFRFGPTGAQSKILTVVPLAIIGFSLVLALFGYSPSSAIKFNWSTAMLASLNLFAVMILDWLYVLDYAGYRPLKGKTNMWVNVIAIVAVGVSVIGMYQGNLFAW